MLILKKMILVFKRPTMVHVGRADRPVTPTDHMEPITDHGVRPDGAGVGGCGGAAASLRGAGGSWRKEGGMDRGAGKKLRGCWDPSDANPMPTQMPRCPTQPDSNPMLEREHKAYDCGGDS